MTVSSSLVSAPDLLPVRRGPRYQLCFVSFGAVSAGASKDLLGCVRVSLAWLEKRRLPPPPAEGKARRSSTVCQASGLFNIFLDHECHRILCSNLLSDGQ